ncbi:hypothetical protein BHE74_00008345 [Ensete ventricosum]|nr:hypothetical protein GW17_00022622 [Ensete ventricosum]RWW83152.1 hypothetical protein BHE74_00008345 [Ensete ventricosum]RZR79606.1 hypothetical protein BHM03_00005353 [Ensete ventricosum]
MPLEISSPLEVNKTLFPESSILGDDRESQDNRINKRSFNETQRIKDKKLAISGKRRSRRGNPPVTPKKRGQERRSILDSCLPGECILKEDKEILTTKSNRALLGHVGEKAEVATATREACAKRSGGARES